MYSMCKQQTNPGKGMRQRRRKAGKNYKTGRQTGLSSAETDSQRWQKYAHSSLK